MIEMDEQANDESQNCIPAVEHTVERPSRIRLFLRCTVDLFLCFATQLPIILIFSILPIATGPRWIVPRKDVWRFGAMPGDETAVSRWAASQKDLSNVRIERLSGGGRIMLRYERSAKSGAAHPDWASMGYRSAYLVSSQEDKPSKLGIQKNMPAMMLAMTFALALVSIYRILRANRKETKLIMFWDRPQPGWWKLLITALPAAILLQILWAVILRSFHVKPDQLLDSISLRDGPSLIMATLAIVLAAPVGEELLFRGLLLGRFSAYGYWRFGVAFSSVLFMLVHPPKNYIAILGIGLLSAWLYLRTKSLWPSMALHALNNAAAVAGAFFTQNR